MTEQPIFDDLLTEFLAAGHSEPIPTQRITNDEDSHSEELATADAGD